ncbi:hypothetical protein NMG60_11033137 [Bertholletia excelsa]
MGISFSCPFAVYNDLENAFDSVIVKSIGFGNEEAKIPVQSIGFNARNMEPAMLQSTASEKMVVERSNGVKPTETEEKVSVEAPSCKEMDTLDDLSPPSPRLDSTAEDILQFPNFDPSNPKHEAAIKLQKVYKSFRTRRKLADCAVLIEQSWYASVIIIKISSLFLALIPSLASAHSWTNWENYRWKLLDFAELKHSSISFFDIEKHETAISRWSRARTRAAKVGKGLSKNGKAQKLALQHWLEAIDPRHRYGHNLHFYYDKWLHCLSKEPFFYWLDIGEGKEVNLVEKCSRSKLQQQCIKYLGPMERKAYEVTLEDGKFLYKQSGELVDTSEPKSAKWIFVLSTSMTLYIGQKKKGTFQHSSFLAGGATSAAGIIVVENGILKAVWPHSGHYRPTPENFQDFLSFLRSNNVDLTSVKIEPSGEEEEEILSKHESVLRSISSEEDLAVKDGLETQQMDGDEKISEKTDLTEEDVSSFSSEPPQPRPPIKLQGKLASLSIPDKSDLVERLQEDNELIKYSIASRAPLDGYVTAEESPFPLQGLLDEEDGEKEEAVPEELILKRINSRKATNSFQLGKQLSCKWTTGAGPRIGCVRDYPTELQFRTLEQLELSPRRNMNFRSQSTLESALNSLRIAACGTLHWVIELVIPNSYEAGDRDNSLISPFFYCE